MPSGLPETPGRADGMQPSVQCGDLHVGGALGEAEGNGSLNMELQLEPVCWARLMWVAGRDGGLRGGGS